MLLAALPSLALLGCDARWTPADTGVVATDAPDVYLTDPSLGSTWHAGEAIPVRAVVTDDVDDASAIVLEIRSDLQGVVDTPRLDATGRLDTRVLLDIGVHQLTIAAIDTDGHEGTAVTTIRVVAGTAPTQPVVVIDPSAPVAGDDLVASLLVPSADPEGDPLAYVWSWTVDGADAAVELPEIDGESVILGQIWTVTVYATDGATASSSASRSVTVGLGGGSGDVTITPASPVTGDTLTCTHAPFLDGGGVALPVTYLWTLDGVDTGVSGPTLDGAVRGDLARCTVLVEDGAGSAYTSDLVTIGNAAPVTGTPTVRPTAPDATSTLTCTPGATTDPEGDPVTATTRWLVDGVEAGTGATLAGAFARGDTVLCEVTPADPYVTGAGVASVAVTVGNAAPGAPTVAFTNPTVVPGGTATCAVTTPAVDPDGDAVSYTWSWERDGAPDVGTSASYDTTGLASGDTLTCIATPSDGFASGPAASADLTLATPSSGDRVASDAWIVLAGTTRSGSFGKAIDSVDDFDGDGRPELVVSAPAGTSSKGAIYLYTSSTLAAGADLFDTDADASWVGHAPGDTLGGGRGVAGLGDFDGDGLGDLVGAAPFNDDVGSSSGAVYVLHGGDSWAAGGDIQAEAVTRFRGATGDWLGTRVSGGDLDGDGLADLVATAPYNDLGADKAGVMAVWYGSTTRYSGAHSLADADALVTGEAAGTELGWSVDVAGDGDGDGYDDVAVGIFYDDTNGTDAGAAAVISGSALGGQETFATAAYLVVHGVGVGDRFGYDVAGVGDVDGDGLEDMLLGGYVSDDLAADAGQARLFYGAVGLNREVDADEADASFFGTGANDQFGSLLAGVGDWDGDGLADFLVGSPRSASAGAEAGAASLYLGRESSGWGSAGADATLRVFGDYAGDWLGDEGAGRVDADGDGYDDVAIGAQQADVAVTGGGAVYVFTGP